MLMGIVMPSFRARGFTLIEMMIVVAIIAIIAAVAYPNYTNFVMRGRRADGRELLPMSEILRQIDQSYSESAALSKEQEALMLYQNMQSDIVQQVMRRLGTVKP